MFIKLLRTDQIIISYDFSYVAALLPLRCNRGSLFYCCKIVSFYHRVLLLVLQNKSLCLSICVCFAGLVAVRCRRHDVTDI